MDGDGTINDDLARMPPKSLVRPQSQSIAQEGAYQSTQRCAARHISSFVEQLSAWSFQSPHDKAKTGTQRRAKAHQTTTVTQHYLSIHRHSSHPESKSFLATHRDSLHAKLIQYTLQEICMWYAWSIAAPMCGVGINGSNIAPVQLQPPQ